MFGSWRRPAAIVVLGVTLSPWLGAGAVALHLEDHSAGHREAHDDGMPVAVHGHHHAPGTPDHQHLLTLPAAAPAPARATLTPPPWAFTRTPAGTAPARDRLVAGAAGLGHDPPSAHRSLPVLRI
jgi:hypothetical protein